MVTCLASVRFGKYLQMEGEYAGKGVKGKRREASNVWRGIQKTADGGSGVATKQRKAAQYEGCYGWRGQKPGNAGSQRHDCSDICTVEVFVLNPQHLSDTMNVFP